jgi:hypothetical protein
MDSAAPCLPTVAIKTGQPMQPGTTAATAKEEEAQQLHTSQQMAVAPQTWL